MNRTWNFEKGAWQAEDFLSAASSRVEYRLTFGQKDDCIHNEGADKMDEYAYVSMVHRTPVSLPCLLETECSFRTYGAPLLILADAVDTLPDGRLQYGRHIEVVGWEKGINVWDLTPDPEAPNGQRTVNLGRFPFPIEDGARFLLTARVDRQGLVVGAELNGRSAQFDCPCVLPEKCYVGITACEGENYFYRFSIR